MSAMPEFVVFKTNAAIPRPFSGRFLMNGELLPMFIDGVSEEAVRAKAEQFWAEHSKPDGRRKPVEPEADQKVDELGNPEPVVTTRIARPKPPEAKSGRGQHFAGKVWMCNKKGEAMRATPDEVKELTAKGWKPGRKWK